MRLRWFGLALLLLVLVGAPAAAMAAVRYVAPNGSGTACTLAAPCRTIGQALATAVSGDRISVAAGIYGDVDGDGAFTSPGDEPAPVGTCVCMILVDKSVTLDAPAGPAATIIRGNATMTLIRVNAPNVSINGFGIRGGTTGIAVNIAANRTRVTGSQISGNSAAGISTLAVTTITGNLVHDNPGIGIDVSLTSVGTHSTVSDNVVTLNGFGIALSGRDHVVSNNIVSGNLGAGILFRNAVVGFTDTGFTVTGNTIVRNRGAGVLLPPSAAGEFAGSVVTRNNIYGNGLVTSPNCGIDNQHVDVLSAENNYWGSATGPGSDPADAVCGDVDAVPFATRAFPISTDAGR